MILLSTLFSTISVYKVSMLCKLDKTSLTFCNIIIGKKGYESMSLLTIPELIFSILHLRCSRME